MNIYEQLLNCIFSTESSHLLRVPDSIAMQIDRQELSIFKDCERIVGDGFHGDCLLEPQKAMIPVWREMWCATGLSHEPTDKKDAEMALIQTYMSAGLTAPLKIVWVRSPWEGMDAIEQVFATKQKSLRNKLWNRPGCHAHKYIEAQVGYKIRDLIVSELVVPIRSSVWGKVGSQVEMAILAQGRRKANRLFTKAGYGNQDSHWLAEYSFYYIFGMTSLDYIASLCRLALNAWWWWPCQNEVIISEKPTELVVNETSLVYIRFADGHCLNS